MRHLFCACVIGLLGILGCDAAGQQRETVVSGASGSDTSVVSYAARRLEATFTDTGVLCIVLTGDVRISYEDVLITSQDARLDGDRVSAGGRVFLVTPVGTFSADSVSYDIARRDGTLSDARLEADPFYGRAERLEVTPEGAVLEEGFFSTCDKDPPHYRLQARRIKYVPDRYVRAEKVRIVIGDRWTILYVPRLTIDLREREPGFSFLPGFRTRLGGTTSVELRQSVSDSSDLAVSEKLYVARSGYGVGAGLFWPSENLRVEGLAFKEWDTDSVSLGGIGRYRMLSRNRFGEGQAILDWRWMESEEFFDDFFHRDFVQLSQMYNHLYLAQRFSGGTLDVWVRDNARDPLLTAEKLPEMRFHAPAVAFGGGRFYLTHTVEAARWSVPSGDFDRIAGEMRIDTTYPVEAAVVRPWVTVGAAYYRADGLDTANLAEEAGVAVSALLLREHRSGMKEFFTPELSLFGRSASKSPEELPAVVDGKEPLRDGAFVRISGDWNFYAAGKADSRLTLSGEYDLSRQEAGTARLAYDLHPSASVTVVGEHVFDLKKGEYSFGAADVVVRRGGVILSAGPRTIAGEINGVEACVQRASADNWGWQVGSSYDFRSASFVSTNVSVWKKLHCWTAEVRVGRDRDNVSVSLVFVPSAFRAPDVWKERFLRWE